MDALISLCLGPFSEHPAGQFTKNARGQARNHQSPLSLMVIVCSQSVAPGRPLPAHFL